MVEGEVEIGAGDLGDALVHLLRVLERTGAQLSARRQDGLDRAAFALLARLVHDGPLRSRALADAALADPSTVSRQVASLVELGMVERQADPADGRATLLAATEQGRHLAAQLRRRRDATVSAVVADWPASDRADLRRLLTRFTDDLERLRPTLLAHCEGTPAGGDR